jgi:hypothetical protein
MARFRRSRAKAYRWDFCLLKFMGRAGSEEMEIAGTCVRAMSIDASASFLEPPLGRRGKGPKIGS